MKPAILLLALIIAFPASTSIAQSGDESKPEPHREKLGIRIGYSGTSNGISDSFGSGLDLCLHFTQRIKEPFSFDITLGAIYLGSTTSDITGDFFGTSFDDVSMRILRLTIAPMVEYPVSDRMDFYLSLGGGLYAVSLLLDQSFQQFDMTNSNFGVNVNAGLMRRLSTNWFVDLNIHLHKFWTEDTLDPNNPDWIYLYSNGDSDPMFWGITAGIALNLF
jgi:opacity protein-like surface antigen